MVPPGTIIDENKEYWTGRAAGYSEINRKELESSQQLWSDCLLGEIRRCFPDRELSSLHVLDIGTGPGFFAILLCEAGCEVTAIDLTPAMLEEARANAGQLAEKIHFMEMNAEEPSFPDESFDVVVSRNLTWDLPHPCVAYRQWTRVLKRGGLLMNFDANWYAYLFDESAREAYEEDRIHTAEHGIFDRNIGQNFTVMEDIARRVPLSNIRRPAWDLRQLEGLVSSCEADEQVWQRVWTEDEKISFASTPMFLVTGVK